MSVTRDEVEGMAPLDENAIPQETRQDIECRTQRERVQRERVGEGFFIHLNKYKKNSGLASPLVKVVLSREEEGAGVWFN